ncbi:PLDc N-terminal domain-containing protein [Nostoc sp. LEGE 06077]|uniref:PLDc N-terminal domain-containing protein n=1 Tax=Nostoc sp. LEGE 06077 TaxID=915325 RepID=UPI00187DFC48|nr:PLDc N-terminal domain-containing protein [Nostoc sp. LEGE 06077]MBE9208020.1 PLDc N-terminal domain-containing protein [Nostoc sp. LEGE 06077]
MIKVVGLLMTGFWLFMVYDCIHNEPERRLWLWILIVINFPGAIAYFVTRWIQRGNILIPDYFSHWTRSRKLWTAQAKSIGNADQYVNLNNNLLDNFGKFDQVETAYKQDAENSDDNLQTLWNAAFIDINNQKFVSAKQYLQTILKIDPDYQYGDASLIYGETLFALQEFEAAKQHLENHIQHWSHPQAYITLAKILSQQGEVETACNYLETIIVKIKESSYFHYKRKRLISKAEKLLRTLKR